VSKRILFAGVSSMKNHAGQDKLYFVADQFGRQGINVTVLVPDIEENRAFFADKPHVTTHFYRPGSALGDAMRKSRVVQNGDWSCIWDIGVGIRSFLLRGRSARNVPIIKDFDEFPSMIENIGPFRRAYLKWIENQMIMQADGFTCASAMLESAVLKVRPEVASRMLRLRVAISADEHRVDHAMARRLRHESKGRTILFYVGSISRMYEDQIDEMIALGKLLRRRGSNAIVRLAGTGPDLEYFKAKASSQEVGDTLEFVGHVRRERDLPSHMEAATALIFPFAANAFNLSRCPTKAFHYAAANRPVVTNQTGEVASLFGNSALYYPERSIEAFADRCQQAIELSAGFDNGIPFESLTWEKRANELRDWLDRHGWLPAGAVRERVHSS